MKKFHYIILLAGVALTACSHPNEDAEKSNAEYANNFALITHDTACGDAHYSYTEAVVYNPWEEGELMARYYLTQESECPIPGNGIRVVIPVTRAIVNSCTHVGFLHELGATDIICGATDKQLIYNEIPADCASIGTMTEPDAERILNAHPQIALLSTYSGDDKAVKQIEMLDIPVVYIHEWTEQHPLGRAEWIRFVGAFVGKEKEADSIFSEVKEIYMQTASRVESDSLWRTRSILSGGDFRGTWYIPSGGTYMGHLFHDAGAVYRYENDSCTGSLPLSLETVLQEFQTADVWVGAPAKSMVQLTEIDERHAWFEAYKNQHVFHFDGQSNANGGNNFWETGVVHPERILQDLIWALYPELLPDYAPYYIRKLKKDATPKL